MSRRRSTIHDAAALRLHPSGVRVPTVTSDVRNPKSSVVTAKNKKPSLAQRDVRGNWIATDAGGDRRVTKRRKVREARSQDPEAAEGSGAGIVGEDAAASREEVPVKVFKDARANRRVAFESNFTFLAESTLAPQDGGTSLLQPSSDFLKCIHHFASQHYGSAGQLFDSAAQYRKEKKEKRRLRMLEAEASGSKDSGNSQEEDSDGEGEDDESVAEGSSNSKSKNKDKGKGKVKHRGPRKKVTERDMYKAFEGSALLCIGMLLQSHISSSLADTRSNVPEAWEEDLMAEDTEGGEADPAPPGRKKQPKREVAGKNKKKGKQAKEKEALEEESSEEEVVREMAPLDVSEVDSGVEGVDEDHLDGSQSE